MGLDEKAPGDATLSMSFHVGAWKPCPVIERMPWSIVALANSVYFSGTTRSDPWCSRRNTRLAVSG